MSEVVRTDPLAFARAPNGRCFLSLHTRWYNDKDGKLRPYFMTARGEKPQDINSKKPDAVVIVPIHIEDGSEPRLVLTSEFRVPIGRRETGFPAGLIEAADFEEAEGDLVTGAKLAAMREVREETGLDFIPHQASPPHLYSSAGMTDESVCIVIGTCTGEPTDQHTEGAEDIVTTLVTHSELCSMFMDPDTAWGKVSWPFLWAFAEFGFPTFNDS